MPPTGQGVWKASPAVGAVFIKLWALWDVGLLWRKQSLGVSQLLAPACACWHGLLHVDEPPLHAPATEWKLQECLLKLTPDNFSSLRLLLSVHKNNNTPFSIFFFLRLNTRQPRLTMNLLGGICRGGDLWSVSFLLCLPRAGIHRYSTTSSRCGPPSVRMWRLWYQSVVPLREGNGGRIKRWSAGGKGSQREYPLKRILESQPPFSTLSPDYHCVSGFVRPLPLRLCSIHSTEAFHSPRSTAMDHRWKALKPCPK